MMTQYIQENYESLRTKVAKVTKNHPNTEDLFNDLVIYLLERPFEYQQDLLEKNKVDHWFTSSAKIQINSQTSPFYYKYKKFGRDTKELQVWEHPSDSTEDTYDISAIKKDISSQLNTYNVYERTLAREHIMEWKSYSEISREYKINRRYVSEMVTPVKKQIFNKVRKEWNG